MISQLVAIFVITLVAYWIRFYVTASQKFIQGIPYESKGTSLKAVDFDRRGTLKLAWKYSVAIWNQIPPYEIAVELLGEYSCEIARLFYLTNWKSARRLVLCSDLKTIKEALSSDHWLQQRLPNYHYLYQASFGKPLGMLIGSGAYWSTARKIVIAGFRKHGIMEAAHLERLVSEEILVVVKGIQDRFLEDKTTDFAVFSPNEIFHEATLNVVFKVLFSRKVSKTDPLEKDLAELMIYNIDMFRILSVLDFLPFLKYFPSLVPSLRENIKFCRRVYEIVANECEMRRSTGSDFHDLMDTMLKNVDEHEGTDPNYFTFENLQATIRDLMLAGSDTTHVTLQHLILFMATNKKDQEMVQDEIDRVVGPHRFPNYTDRARMIYTQAVIQETLRLGSTTPMSARFNTKERQLGGMTLKKGTLFVPLFLGVNHSKQIWEDPMIFRPNRFICETTGQIINRDKTLPFSYGPRACPGELMARVSLFLFTVALLRDFEWELSDTHPPPSTQCHGGLTRAPAQYYVKIRRRFH